MVSSWCLVTLRLSWVGSGSAAGFGRARTASWRTVICNLARVLSCYQNMSNARLWSMCTEIILYYSVVYMYIFTFLGSSRAKFCHFACSKFDFLFKIEKIASRGLCPRTPTGDPPQTPDPSSHAHACRPGGLVATPSYVQDVHR